jgi:hypothetical protein
MAGINWRLETRTKLVALFGGKCVDCGYDKHLSVLHFDHVDPSLKKFSIHARLALKPSPERWDELVAEASKCVLRCANCHLERSYKEGHVGRPVGSGKPEKSTDIALGQDYLVRLEERRQRKRQQLPGAHKDPENLARLKANREKFLKNPEAREKWTLKWAAALASPEYKEKWAAGMERYRRSKA